jgi:hypothetical protein
MARTDWTFALSIAATLAWTVGAISIPLFAIGNTGVTMRKFVLAILASAVLGPFAATGANALPIAPSVAPTSSMEQVGWVCNPLGRCWWQPNYDRRYGYYRRYRSDDDWPRRHGYGPRYWGPGYSWGDGHGG